MERSCTCGGKAEQTSEESLKTRETCSYTLLLKSPGPGRVGQRVQTHSGRACDCGDTSGRQVYEHRDARLQVGKGKGETGKG